MQLGDILNSAIGSYQGAQPAQGNGMNSLGNGLGNGIMDLAGYLKRRRGPQNQDVGNMPPTGGFDPGMSGGGWDPNSAVNA